MCVNVCMERRNIIWFYFITPLGQRVNFIWCMCSFFSLSLSASLVYNIHSRKNLYQTKSYYSIYPYQIQMMWVFQWNTIHCDWKHVSINLYQMWTSTWIYFICQRRPKKRREESERASFDALECVKGKKKLSLTVQRTILDWIFLILTDSQFFSPAGSSTLTLHTMCTRMPNIA